MSKPYVNYPQSTTATIVIATSTTVSPEVDLADYDLVGLITPATFDGTAITFTGAIATSGTFVPVAASNAAATAYTITTAASTLTPINPDIFAGIRFIKVVTSSAQTTTDTIFTLLLRKRKQ